MRIITGTARGVNLVTLEGEEITRPTTQRTKEGIFSAIQFELTNRRVLDLFSGCGQMALEALSRGAQSAVMIDESAEAVEIIKTNAKKTGLIKKEKFDLIFLDPPYSKSIKDEILKKITRTDIIADGCIIVCETDKDEIDGDVYGLTLRKKYKYSRAITYIFDYHASDNETSDAD